MSNWSTADDVETLAQALEKAHRSGIPVSATALPIPATLAEAGRVQAAVARRLGAEVAGWKVGMAPNGGEAVAAPLFGHLLLPDGGSFLRRGAAFLAIEVEIGFRLSSAPSGAGWDNALGDAFVGIEVVESRFVEGPGAAYPAFLADNIANGAYVVGPGRTDWRSLDLTGLRCRVWRDADLVHDEVGGHPQGSPLAPLEAILASPVDRLGGFAAGQIVTTGTLCGIVQVAGACRIRAEVEGFGEVSVAVHP